jgi:lipopolysaccharide export system permease protein
MSALLPAYALPFDRGSPFSFAQSCAPADDEARLRTLHAYLIRQVLASLLLTVLVFTFVLLLANALKEIIPLLVNRQLSFGIVAEAVGLLIPFVWVFALPMGMLTATLLIFGRFSADQELTAMRASGISLLSATSPILLLSLFLCALSALVNMEIGPRCRVAYNDLLFKFKVQIASAQLPEGRFIKEVPGFIFYCGQNRGGELRDVMVFKLKEETNVVMTIKAPRGKVAVDMQNRVVNLSLYDATTLTFNEGRATPGAQAEISVQVDLQPAESSSHTTSLSDLTFTQLRDELHDIERRLSTPQPIANLTKSQMHARKFALQLGLEELTEPVRFQMHRQAAFSFACLGFTLVGIPLGVRMHRRETNIGIAVALVLVALYYSFILVGQSLDTRPDYAPHLMVWLPNFIFQAVGAVLLWRVNRGL